PRLQKRLIENDVAYEKLRQSRLFCSQQLTRSAQLEIFLSDNKSIIRLSHDSEPFRGDGRALVARQKNAVALLRAATDTPSQLVKLRESKAFSMFDNHH